MIVSSLDALFHPVVNFFMMGILATLIYYGGLKVIAGDVRLGDFVAFTRYMEILVWPLIALGWVFSLYQRARSAYERIEGVLSSENTIISGDKSAENIKGTITLRGVGFEFEDTSILRDIDLEIKAKELVGITGPIGAGKTVLINLIPRLYDVSAGIVEIDGVDVREYRIEELRRSIAYVPQDTFLFSTSIRENLLFANRTSSEEEVEQALRIADAWGFISSMPEGLDTVVGERGVSLSGGQKQRLSLARALLLKRPVILMDDCLSAVDSETEKHIIANLKEKWKDSTSIVVSHRLSAFKTADKVFVMDAGNIVQSGEHDELKDMPGLYRSIFMKQQIEEEL